MLGKKGGVAIGEVRGILTFMFVMVIAGLVFYGCAVSEAKKDYKEFQFSKEEVEITRDLNYILEKPVGQGKTVADLIIALTEKLYLDGQRLEFIENVDEDIKGYFAGYFRFMIFNDVGGCWYDSDNRDCIGRKLSDSSIAEGSAILPIPFNNKFEPIELVLQSIPS